MAGCCTKQKKCLSIMLKVLFKFQAKQQVAYAAADAFTTKVWLAVEICLILPSNGDTEVCYRTHWAARFMCLKLLSCLASGMLPALSVAINRSAVVSCHSSSTVQNSPFT